MPKPTRRDTFFISYTNAHTHPQFDPMGYVPRSGMLNTQTLYISLTLS